MISDAVQRKLAEIEMALRRGGEEPASRQELEGLEVAAVWDPEHVEDRLRDHFSGRPNKWVESIRL